jgi:hypothetical protein
MLSSTLTSKRAIQVDITVMRALSTFREMLATHEDLADKLAELEQEHEEEFRVVLDAVRQSTARHALGRERRRIGFPGDEDPSSL